MFGRKRSKASSPDDDLEELELDELDEEEDDDEPAVAAPSRPTGPWDAEDMPRDDVERVDLGGLLVPVSGGHELRVDVDPQTGTVVSVTLGTPSSLMQVAGFAAPRTDGVWTEIRAEIAQSIQAGGGTASEVEGPYGVELRASVPTDQPGQLAPARFLGVDGPRWFVRAMVQGRAAAEPGADEALVEAFRQVVVVRGADAMAVRDALPLRLPADVATPLEAGAPATEPALDNPLERPPLNTETR